MRISIWQQFSSNHSAGFTLVGTFESVDDAQKAAGEIRRLLDGLAAWFSDPEHYSELRAGMEGLSNPLIPIEKEFAQRYEIREEDWTDYGGGIDWVTNLDVPEEALAVVDNMVFLSATDDTWQGSGPFRKLLEKMGGSVAEADADTTSIVANFSTTAPDEATAVRVADVLNRYAQLPSNSPEHQLLLPSIGNLPDFSADELQIIVEGRQLKLENIQFWDVEWEDGPRFARGLESIGFTDVVYHFVEKKISFD